MMDIGIKDFGLGVLISSGLLAGVGVLSVTIIWCFKEKFQGSSSIHPKYPIIDMGQLELHTGIDQAHVLQREFRLAEPFTLTKTKILMEKGYELPPPSYSSLSFIDAEEDTTRGVKSASKKLNAFEGPPPSYTPNMKR